MNYNLRNLSCAGRRSLLTALAFTLVVGLLTVMLAFVNGMYRLTEGSGQPGNVMVLSDGATDELFSNLGFDDSSDVMREPGICSDEQGRPLAAGKLYIVVNQPSRCRRAARRKRGASCRSAASKMPRSAGRVHTCPCSPAGS